MSTKILATSLLALALAGPAFAQSNPRSCQRDRGQEPWGTMGSTNGMKMKKLDKNTTGSTTHNLNKENCGSLTGKGSLQTHGENSNTENTENTCAAITDFLH